MLSNFKTVFQNITSKDKKEDFYEEEDIQAVIILLLEACQIDGNTGKDELEYIKKLLINKFSFTPDQAEKNLLDALEKSDERIEIFSQIKIILNEMDHEERIDVIEMMWGVILSDGIVDDFEANLMRRMNGLLYVSGEESALAKQRALNQA